jgi:ubiquinone/menaquinone biosynthesis C-methylase UbiE
VKLKSIWGDGEELTLQTLKKLKIKGKWLDLAAGDGRYVESIIDHVGSLTLADINETDLQKIYSQLPPKYQKKVDLRVFDMTGRFDLEDASYDGILCTGTLHLFKKEILEKVFKELDRVLKPRGTLVLDFATEVFREFPGGRKEFDSNINYSTTEAKKLLNTLLKDYQFTSQVSEYTDDVVGVAGLGYKSVGKFILIVAQK